MTPDTQQARRVIERGRLGGVVRSAHAHSQSQPYPQAQPFPPHPQAGARRAQEDAGIVGAIPFFAVLAVTIAGVYVAWHQGSAGGGEGGVVGGVALLIAAIVRLLLPARLVGLLAVRKRANDVVTLAIFGIGLLVAGLVLPR